jgi:amino acid transporter
LSTVVLLATYALVVLATQSYAGIGTKGIGLQNPNNSNDVFNALGGSVFGGSGFGSFLTHLLLFMVLTSAAASTQTTILPTARTTLSMAVYKAIPKAFARIHRRFLTPTVSTVVMGLASIALYVVFNYVSKGAIIGDSVSALGTMIAFYYGLTGFACVWYYRATLTESARSFWLRGVLPLLGGLILFGCMIYNFWHYWNPINSYTTWKLPFSPHWDIGGVFVLDAGVLILGVVLMYVYKAFRPAYFRGEVLNRDTPTRVPEDIGVPVGLFGIDPFEDGPATP